ncbi:MAG: hypothetical protein ACFFAH_09190 [Promethearchaeota archaeon]
MSNTDEMNKENFANEFMSEEGLKGKPTLNKIMEIIDIVGFDKNKIKQKYLQFKEKEDFANEVMMEVGIKGKANRIKIMRIIDIVGHDRRKIKTALLRSTITERIHHE